MKTSIVDESVWVERLRNLPRWNPPLVDTLVIAPHPDDETLAAGGLIASLCAQGVKVSVVAVTDGENAYETTDGERQCLRVTRELEQTQALQRLGVPAAAIHRLRLTDSGVADQETQLTDCLLPLISAKTHVIAPWQNDFHPDHEACGRAAEAVARVRGAKLSYYFFWTWHRGTPKLFDALSLVSFPLTEEECDAKWEALMCHVSQLEREDGNPILPLNLLDPARRKYEVFLPS
jgi:LmbE family N-acetylglucosaminyl deacetylase